MEKAKIIDVLRKYEEQISDKDFDLEAWKSAASTFVSRVFGEKSPKLKQLEDLRIDYSSWALRDAPSNYHPLETCKRKAKQIIHSAIEEIEAFGPVQPRSMREILASVYSEAELKAILSKTDRTEELKKVLEKAGKAKNVQALVMILQNYPMD